MHRFWYVFFGYVIGNSFSIIGKDGADGSLIHFYLGSGVSLALAYIALVACVWIIWREK